MSDQQAGNGTCLCGAVNVHVKNISSQVGACHCTMCQKWVGGPLMAVDCGTEVSFSGEENITNYSSSDWAERGFCNKCGSHLYYHLKDANQYIMPVGLFDSTIPFVFDHEIFIESKPEYYHFGNKTKTMTGAEVFAQYAPKDS